jgi:hypothetical protein
MTNRKGVWFWFDHGCYRSIYLEGLRKTTRNLNQDSRCPQWDSNGASLIRVRSITALAKLLGRMRRRASDETRLLSARGRRDQNCPYNPSPYLSAETGADDPITDMIMSCGSVEIGISYLQNPGQGR